MLKMKRLQKSSPKGRKLEPVPAGFEGNGDIFGKYIAQMGQEKFEEFLLGLHVLR